VTPVEAMEALVAAASRVEGLHGYRGDQLGQVQLPAVVVGVPTLRWENYDEAPTSARFPVTLLLRLDNLSFEGLLGHLPVLQAAIEGDTPATVAEALPVAHEIAGGAAGYELTVEFPL
jgi:hypothetical protein